MHCFNAALLITILDGFVFPDRGVFQSEIFDKLDVCTWEGWSNKLIQAGTYWCFFCPSVWDTIRFWPRPPDERQRIISKADLIYVLCRWGHPNDLPHRGHHQSPPTRGYSKHAWEGELVGRPNNPQGCVHMWTSVCMLHRLIIFKCLALWMCAFMVLLIANFSGVLSCLWCHREP